HIERGLVVIDAHWTEHAEKIAGAAAAESLERAARALLVDPYDGDPWVSARAGELLLRAGSYDRGDEAHASALAKLDNSLARHEIVARWIRAVSLTPRDAQLDLCMRAADRALAGGEADEAYRWAQSASSLAAHN